MGNVFAVVGTVAFAIVVTLGVHLAFGLLMAFPIMWTYNAFVPETFSLTELTYWNAYAAYLFVVCLSIPFKSGD